jgi:hypothetical protein
MHNRKVAEMSLPDDWYVDAGGVPRPKKWKRQAFDLSGLTVDEVSFVKRGANQRAHIVLYKSADQESTMPTEDPYGDATLRYDQAAEISKVLDLEPSLYDQRYAPKVKRSAVPTMLAELAKSDDPKAIAALLNRYPQLYDALEAS